MDKLAKGGGADLEFDLFEDGGTPVVKLRGELDLTTAPRLEAGVAPVIADRPERLVIEASGLEFADSSAIALLVRWTGLVGQLEIRQPPELLRRVITRMGLSDRLYMVP